jgi:hypothetical protein
MTFRCADSTELMNFISQDILPMGVYTFPGFNTSNLPNALAITNDWVLPSISSTGTGYQINIKGPWIVRSKDGMTIRETLNTDHRIDFPGPGNYHVGLLAKYLVSTDPILELRYITFSDWATWAEKDYFVTFADVVIPNNATNVTAEMIDIEARLRPRGTLFLTEDAFTAGSVIREATDYLNMPNDPIPHELVYVKSENAIYFNDTTSSIVPNWIRVDNPLKGISTFLPPSGRIISIPQIARNRDYHVNITLIQDSAGNVGEIWIERRTTDFIVHNTGTANTQFMWNLQV